MAEDIQRDPVLVFDGDCGFCTTCVNFAERYLRASLSSGGWDAVPYQFADLAALDARAGGRGLVTVGRAEQEILWVTPSGAVHGGARAAARLLLRSGGPWAYLGAFLTLAPVRPLASAGYRLVARHRHQLPGGTAACALPRRARA